MEASVPLSSLFVAFRESLQILGATAVCSILAFPFGVLLAIGVFHESEVWRRVLSLLHWLVGLANPLIILLLILWPSPYKNLFAFSSSNLGATIWALAFLFSLRFSLNLAEVLRDDFTKEREMLTAVGASPWQIAKILIRDARPLWIARYFSSCAAVLTVTSGAGLTQLAYEKGYFFFQSTPMLLIAIFLALFALLVETTGVVLGRLLSMQKS